MQGWEVEGHYPTGGVGPDLLVGYMKLFLRREKTARKWKDGRLGATHDAIQRMDVSLMTIVYYLEVYARDRP